MKNHPHREWSNKDIAILLGRRAQGVPPDQIAVELKRSATAVRRKADEFPAISKTKVVEEANPREDFWRKEASRLTAELAARRHDNELVTVLVEKAVDLAPRSYQPVSKPIKRAIRSASTPQTPVLMLSDTHIGQFIQPDQTLGFGNYNFELFLRRLARLERSVFSILEDHTNTAIPEIVVVMLGDMMHGNLSHAVEAGQTNTLFTQFYNAGHAFAQFLRNLSALAPLRVHSVVGNHTRWGTQKKMPTDNRYSNLDQFLYAYTQALVRDIPTINWTLDKQPFALFDVQGFQFYAGHGDHMRGGDKALGIPNHAVGRQISVNTQLFNRAGRRPPNFYLFGHFHRPIELPHALGEVIINGGFPGVDGFGLTEAFNPSHPLQKFFLTHPKFGRTAEYNLRLDLGDETPHKYELPAGFAAR